MSEPSNSKSKKLPGQVKALGLVSFFNDASSEIVYPLLPKFLLTLGAGPEILGVMEGIAESIAALLKYFSGWWSDKIKKHKTLAAIGYTLSSVLRPLAAFAAAGWHVAVLRGADRIGKGIRSAPRDALLAASVDKSMRGRAFGFHRAMDNLGAVVGPLIALALLYAFNDDLRKLFLATAIPSLFTVFLIVFVVKEKKETETNPSPSPSLSSQTQSAKERVKDKKAFGIFLASMLLFTLGNSSDLFLVMHAQNKGLALEMVPVLWIALHLSKSAFNTPGGVLADKIGYKKTIFLGWLVYALCYAGFAFADAQWQFWALFVVYGLYYGLTEGPEKALVASLAPKNKRGTGFGLYHASVGVAALPASVAAGFIWKHWGPQYAFGLGAALAVMAALTLAALPNEAAEVKE